MTSIIPEQSIPIDAIPDLALYLGSSDSERENPGDTGNTDTTGGTEEDYKKEKRKRFMSKRFGL